jgi:hypothetical protein
MTKITARPKMTRFAFALLWLFVFTVPFNHATEIPTVDLVSKIAGIAAVCGGAAAVIARKQIRLLGGVHLTMAGFIIWSTVTLCWSINPDLTVQRITTYLQLFVVVLLIWEMCLEEKDILRILGAFVLGTIVPALSTLKAFLPGEETLYQRAAEPGYDPNNLAFMLALSLPVSYYLILREKSSISALYRLQMGFALCAILLSGTAATMIAMAVGLSLMCWTFHLVPLRARTNAFVLLIVLAGAAILFFPSALWNHFTEESKNGGITLTSVMSSGIESVRATPPGGFGAGTMTAELTPSGVNRRIAFPMFSETGVVGIACFVALLGGLFLSAERMSGATKSFWFTVLGVWAVGVCSLNWECSQPAWLLFGLLAAHAACLRHEGVAGPELDRRRNYYIDQSAEVCS